MRIVVLASGRGSNLQAIIDSVKKGALEVEIGAVVSDKGSAQALERAVKNNIPTRILPAENYTTRAEYDRALAQLITGLNADLVVLAGFMRLLGNDFISKFPNRIINIHPSLLPAFPGLDAQKQAVEYGAKVSGCTVHFVDEGMDTGPIIAQKCVPVIEGDTTETLSARILQEEHRLYAAVLALLGKGLIETDGRKVTIKRS
ncbi:phosphoribosylglycinamide formyltransferase [Metallumcola ferriviriculae]|uniref:Phosphoribosylglycinamide formyltransferase n=1 Tax=Metallumcola ferriviriculae TaxID=3039180 RepID=A0AAU0UT65_9FIRM|nr:phosphoribosylglycinamide formyltransferase [Desulfitibacteraceae bacterium MK1]